MTKNNTLAGVIIVLKHAVKHQAKIVISAKQAEIILENLKDA